MLIFDIVDVLEIKRSVELGRFLGVLALCHIESPEEQGVFLQREEKPVVVVVAAVYFVVAVLRQSAEFKDDVPAAEQLIEAYAEIAYMRKRRELLTETVGLLHDVVYFAAELGEFGFCFFHICLKLVVGHVERAEITVVQLYVRVDSDIHRRLHAAFIGIRFFGRSKFLKAAYGLRGYFRMKVALDAALLRDVVEIPEPADDIDQFLFGNRHI